MAVFPRIVLKNTTDTASAVNTAIATGGTDAVAVGEVVLRRAAGRIYFHGLDSTGTPVQIGVTSIDDLSDVDTTTSSPAVNSLMRWDGTNWVPGNLGSYSINALGDVDTATKLPIKGQSLNWDGTQWIPGIAATRIGRGDGGDFDVTEIDSSFVFGVWGGGDFDTTTQDLPIELLRKDTVDGCEIISDYTAATVTAPISISVSVNTSISILISAAPTLDTPVSITVTPLVPDRVGARAFVEITNPVEIVVTRGGYPALLVGPPDYSYFQNFAIQTYRWDGDLMVDWWAE